MKEAKERERERRELRYSAALYEFHVELEFSWRHNTFSSTPGGFISGPYSLNLRDSRAWASGPKPPAGVRPPYYKIAFVYFTSTFLSQTRSHIDSQSPKKGIREIRNKGRLRWSGNTGTKPWPLKPVSPIVCSRFPMFFFALGYCFSFVSRCRCYRLLQHTRLSLLLCISAAVAFGVPQREIRLLSIRKPTVRSDAQTRCEAPYETVRKRRKQAKEKQTTLKEKRSRRYT